MLRFGWTLGDRPTFVLTERTDLLVPEGANVRFMSAPTAQAIRALAAETPKRLWVFCGAPVVTAALLGGAVAVLDITIVPEAIGAGIPLFTEAVRAPTTVAPGVPHPSGSVRLGYDLVGA